MIEDLSSSVKYIGLRSFCKPIGGEKLEQQGKKNKGDIFANLCWPGHLICESFEVGSSSSIEVHVWIVFHAANVVFHSVLHLMLWEKIEIVCLENIWTQALRRREFCWNSVTWQLNIEALFPSECFLLFLSNLQIGHWHWCYQRDVGRFISITLFLSYRYLWIELYSPFCVEASMWMSEMTNLYNQPMIFVSL